MRLGIYTFKYRRSFEARASFKYAIFTSLLNLSLERTSITFKMSGILELTFEFRQTYALSAPHLLLLKAILKNKE